MRIIEEYLEEYFAKTYEKYSDVVDSGDYDTIKNMTSKFYGDLRDAFADDERGETNNTFMNMYIKGANQLFEGDDIIYPFQDSREYDGDPRISQTQPSQVGDRPTVLNRIIGIEINYDRETGEIALPIFVQTAVRELSENKSKNLQEKLIKILEPIIKKQMRGNNG